MDNLNKMEIYNIQAIWEKKIKEQKGKGKHKTQTTLKVQQEKTWEGAK